MSSAMVRSVPYQKKKWFSKKKKTDMKEESGHDTPDSYKEPGSLDQVMQEDSAQMSSVSYGLKQEPQQAETGNNKPPKILPPRQLPYLMMNTSVPLNASASKEIVIGLDATDPLFNVVIQIARRSGSSKLGVNFSKQNWELLMSYEHIPTGYFAGYSIDADTEIMLGDFTGTFRTLYGKRTLIITKNNDNGSPYAADNIAIQEATWKGILACGRLISHTIGQMENLSLRTASHFETLGGLVLEPLRNHVDNEEKRNDALLHYKVRDFFLQTNIGLEVKDLEDNGILYNLSLFCIQLFVSQFKLNTFYENFANEI